MISLPAFEASTELTYEYLAMTATQDLAVEHVGPADDSAMCDVCGHARTLHDRVAERYCDATQHNGLSRVCVCSTPDSPSSHYGH